MACRGLVQNALSLVCSFPSRATRKTIVSPRSFQVLARESSRRLSSPLSRTPSQDIRNCPRCASCRAFHGSTKAWVQETDEPGQSHDPQASKATTDEEDDGNRNSPSARLSMRSAQHDLAELVRTNMRRVPQPVTIVTSTNTETHTDANPNGWHGATISSFNTVTLHPEPIISFNIKKISSTFAAIEASGKMWVHFLTQMQSAIELADRFANPRNKYPFRTRGEQDKETSWQRAPTGKVPTIPNDRGAGGRIAFILECAYLKDKTVAIGDHVVLFASVTDVVNTSPSYVFEGTAFHPRRPCLVYADGEYQGVTPLERSSKEKTTRDGPQRVE